MATAVRNLFLTSKLIKPIKPRFLARNMSQATWNSEDDPDDVLFKTVGDKVVITLNRPKALNALNLSMVNKLLPKLQEWELSKKMILIKGAGEKAFCAGGDVRAVTEAGMRGTRYGEVFFRKEYMINGMIGTYRIPYIAFIDGIVMGGGVGLSVHAPYRIATERTVFAMPETQIGLFPDVGGSYFLSRLTGKLGLYLALTGQRLRGADVLKAGIATHFVSSSELGNLEKVLMGAKTDVDIKRVLKDFSIEDPEQFSLAKYMPKINQYFDAYTIEEIVNNLKQDLSQWASDTLSLLCKMSPTSLKLTKKELELGAKMNLFECLEMEYRLVRRCMDSGEFYEGVRALLIDKDHKPKWDPPTLIDVSDEMIKKYFLKLPEKEELRHRL